MERQNRHGGTVDTNRMPSRSGREKILFKGTFRNQPAVFGMDEKHLDKHTLLLGSTGCGKTTLFNGMIDQIQRKMTADDVMIIFDSKGDFYSRFGSRPNSVVLGNSPQYYPQSARWNIFREIQADGWDDRLLQSNAQEICKNLFADRVERTNNPFFPNAARDLLASLLIFFLRTGKEDIQFRSEFLDNGAFRRTMDRCTLDDLLDFLSFDEDARSVMSYIEGGGDQGNGVLSEMYSVLRDIFMGVFAEKGMFSMRDFVRQKGGRTLFVEYDLAIGQTLTPVYRLLFDLALKEALGRQSQEGNVYLFFDEFRLVPHLQHIDDAVNFGRSLGVKVFAGVQNVEQLFEIYKESRGRSILAGFSNLFLFHNDDPSTLRYLTERLGRNVVLDEYFDLDGQMRLKPRSGHVAEDWDLTAMDRGQAIVSLAFSEPFRFCFQEYK